MPTSRPILPFLGILAVSLIPTSSGCGDGPSRPGADAPSASPADSETSAALSSGLTEVINAAEARYRPVQYNYDEDLLAKIDQVESHLAGRSKGPPPRVLPSLDKPAEEQAHFRETIKRWEAKAGRSLRESIDPLISEVAARSPGGPAFHPDFHKKFGLVFDTFIPIEIAEIHERRNRAVREGADLLFTRYRDKHLEAVKPFQATLDRQYPAAPPTIPQAR